MPTLTFISKYKKNTGRIMSVAEMKETYFYGTDWFKSNDGTDLSDSTYEFYLESAQKEVENYLGLKLNFQLFDDNGSYNRDDYHNSYPIIRTIYPVNEALSLIGFYKKVEQIIYPRLWLSSNKTSSGIFMRRISIVPTSGVYPGTSADLLLVGSTVLWGQLGWSQNLPDYWAYQYLTGFTVDTLPMDLVNVIGKFASIGIYNIFGDLILGAGIASQSLSIDGLSQSISTTSSATAAGFSSRIIQYSKEIKDTLGRVASTYKGLNFTSL